MPLRRAISAALLLSAVACAGRSSGDGRVADASAPPRGAFQVVPAEEAAAVKNPHDHKGKPLCQRCHAPDLKLTSAPNALCGECHSFVHKSHPVDVVQKTPAPGLPLLAGGKLACHTCHDPHQRKVPLRTGFNNLCKTCHAGH